MQRRAFLVTLAGGLGLALPALAAYSDDVVLQLAKQGYQAITVTTTWLGRVRIVATRDGGMREIVLNPRTGEILRDLWTSVDGTQRTVSIVDDVAGGQTSSSGNGSGKGTSDGTSGNGSSGSDNGSGTETGGSTGSDGSGGSDGGSSGGSDGGGTDTGTGTGTGTGHGGGDDGGGDDGGSDGGLKSDN